MEKLNKWNCLSYSAAARELGVSVWRIRYGVDAAYLSAPSVVLKKRRLFSPQQVKAMRRFFLKEDAAKKQASQATSERPCERQ